MCQDCNPTVNTQYYRSAIPRMNPEIKAEWIKALRSGKFIQGTNVLASRKPHQKTKYCCLGVLCELRLPKSMVTLVENTVDLKVPKEASIKKYDDQTTALPFSVRNEADLDEANPLVFSIRRVNGPSIPHSLATLNDQGLTFDQIADVIDYFL